MGWVGGLGKVLKSKAAGREIMNNLVIRIRLVFIQRGGIAPLYI